MFCEGSAGTFASHRKYSLRDAYKPFIPLHNQHLVGSISSSSTRTAYTNYKSRPSVDLLLRIFDLLWLKYLQSFTWLEVGPLGREFMCIPRMIQLKCHFTHETECPWPFILKSLIGRKGPDRSSSLHIRRSRRKGLKKLSWTISLHGFLYGKLKIRFHSLLKFVSIFFLIDKLDANFSSPCIQKWFFPFLIVRSLDESQGPSRSHGSQPLAHVWSGPKY